MSDSIAAPAGHLAFLAHHDPLTGLPNRAALDLEIEAAVARGEPALLAYVDLNDFKRVNDSLGHATGDRLLREVALRLRAVVRPGDVLARIGGDEFVVLVGGLTVAGRAEAESLGQRLVDALAAPCAVGAAELLVDASVGVSLFPADATDADALHKHADAAMYEAKASGGGVAVYGGETVDPLEHLALAARLRRAIDAGELELHYQPVHRISDGAILGVEALVRWRHPQQGLIAPERFVPVAERTGVIDALGAWVLDTAAAQMRAWQDRGLLPNVGVNVSPRQLRRAGAVGEIVDAVSAHGVDFSRFVLEITESSWTIEVSRLLPVLHELRAAGFVLAIDDFGAGYSSLWRLRELPVQVIKVDRAFQRGVPGDAQATAVFEAILRLADAVGCDVVAEGVETAAQARHLARVGCGIAQGYHFGRPMAPADFDPILEAGIVPERRIALART
jgi:diguanylate cyclase (GGDEF)-like protein